jgi:hypothetical protein
MTPKQNQCRFWLELGSFGILLPLPSYKTQTTSHKHY